MTSEPVDNSTDSICPICGHVKAFRSRACDYCCDALQPISGEDDVVIMKARTIKNWSLQ